MRNYWFFTSLIPLLLCSCEQEVGGEPVIAVDSVYVNREKVMLQEEYLIPYDAEVRVFTSLSVDNGTLKSFSAQVKCEKEDADEEHLRDLTYIKEDVSDTSMTNLSDALLRFRDGVACTKVEVLTRVAHYEGEELKLKMYLNTEHNGIREEISFLILEKDDVWDDELDED